MFIIYSYFWWKHECFHIKVCCLFILCPIIICSVVLILFLFISQQSHEDRESPKLIIVDFKTRAPWNQVQEYCKWYHCYLALDWDPGSKPLHEYRILSGTWIYLSMFYAWHYYSSIFDPAPIAVEVNSDEKIRFRRK